MSGFKNTEELDKKIIDNLERMALNVGGSIRQLVKDGVYSIAVRELGVLIQDATMAMYVCRMRCKEHGTTLPSVQKMEMGEAKE